MAVLAGDGGGGRDGFAGVGLAFQQGGRAGQTVFIAIQKVHIRVAVDPGHLAVVCVLPHQVIAVVFAGFGAVFRHPQGVAAPGLLLNVVQQRAAAHIQPRGVPGSGNDAAKVLYQLGAKGLALVQLAALL